ncbi:free fatty acid receptor 2-like [Denticeps clupeoides]|uniref:free fatty acid receptor 2-like n=1 Tax=Denticeps clupeoides TaxID=299321 RepID=UPI0010A4EBE0|nr:free fatty acid receptor 2-like [Denticeps clupeoides]
MSGVISELLLGVYILTFLIGLPANCLAFYAFSKKVSKNPAPTDILLLNLTSSDLLFLIFLPLKMYEARHGVHWYLPRTLCSITSFVFFTTIYTSSLLLMAVSVDRYLGVAFPIHYRQLRKSRYAVASSVFIWLTSGVHCSVIFVTEHVLDKRNSTSDICYENFTAKQRSVLLPVRFEMSVVLCFVPLIICMFCYLKCIHILYTQPRISPEKKRKAIGMAVGTLVVFLVCSVPFNLAQVVGFISNNSPKWRQYALLLSTFNTCLDPIIFYFSSSTFRNNTKHSVFAVLRLHKKEELEGTSSRDGDQN